MSQSIIYLVNSSTQEVSDNGIINPGTIVRKYGQNLNLSGNGIQVAGSGYYDITASFTIVPTETGEVTVTLLKDGVAVPGATATETAAAAGDYVNLSVIGIVRESCYCCDGMSSLTFLLTGIDSSVVNSAIKGEKL